MIWKMLAFVKIQILVARSYRLRYIMQFVTMGIPLLGFFFMARVFANQEIEAVGAYGGNYMSFILVGTAVTLFSGIGLRSVTGVLSGAQRSGTLEIFLLTRTSFPMLILGWTTYPFIRAMLGITIYIVGGFILIGISFSNANVLPALVTIGLILIVMFSIGLISAAFLVVFKQGDPFTGLFLLAGTLLAGTVYPVTVFPGWLQAISGLFPQTHALEAARLAILNGHSITELSGDLGVLLVYATVLLPISILIFQLALRRAMKEGSLAQY